MKAKELIREAAEMKAELIERRKYLHSHAETGFALDETLAYVRSELEGMGYAPEPCGRAGLVALAGGKNPGRVFLLRADMDALPIAEQSGVDFASKNGNMHACGHDMHTAMLLGAAKLLKMHEDELAGTVKLMFQPAEEIFEGSADMIRAGVLEAPHVDAAMMIHVMAGMPLAPGTVIVSDPGIGAPAADVFEIRVRGRGCHGSMPEKGIDPVTAAAHIIIALQEIRARELSMGDHAVLTIPPQRESIKDYRRITCKKGKYLAKQPQNFRNEPTSSQKTMNQTVKTMHRIALVFAMESCMKNA